MVPIASSSIFARPEVIERSGRRRKRRLASLCCSLVAIRISIGPDPDARAAAAAVADDLAQRGHRPPTSRVKGESQQSLMPFFATARQRFVDRLRALWTARFAF